MNSRTIILATRNAGKVRELNAMFSPLGLSVQGLDSFPQVGEIEETGSTFAENALLKAKTVATLTGLVAVADDSGLEVDALGGAPGVYSARYSDEPGRPATDERNNQKLLLALSGSAEEGRSARFRSAMAACAPDGQSIATEGSWEGIIAFAPAGNGGFGYDPLFYDPQAGCTAAELSAEEKNRRSHRGRAVRALLEAWPDFWSRITGA